MMSSTEMLQLVANESGAKQGKVPCSNQMQV